MRERRSGIRAPIRQPSVQFRLANAVGREVHLSKGHRGFTVSPQEQGLSSLSVHGQLLSVSVVKSQFRPISEGSYWQPQPRQPAIVYRAWKVGEQAGSM